MWGINFSPRDVQYSNSLTCTLLRGTQSLHSQHTLWEKPARFTQDHLHVTAAGEKYKFTILTPVGARVCIQPVFSHSYRSWALWSACRRTPSPSVRRGCILHTVGPGPQSTSEGEALSYCSTCHRNTSHSAYSDAAKENKCYYNQVSRMYFI